MKKESSNLKSETSLLSSVQNETTLSLPVRFALTLLGCIAVYLLVTSHFFLVVRTAHFLGDAAYLPASVSDFTSAMFRIGKVSAFFEIVFLVIWLAIVGFSCWGIFKGAILVKNLFGSILFDDANDLAGYKKCFKNAFYALLPVLILSLVTLAITPVQSHNSDSASMSEIAETISFSRFLSAMDEGTIALFGVSLFVVLVLLIVYLLMKILPDNALVTFGALFVGVIVGVLVMMPLMWFGKNGFDIIKLQTQNSYLSHFVLFAVYSIASAIFILPTLDKKKVSGKYTSGKTIGRKLPA